MARSERFGARCLKFGEIRGQIYLLTMSSSSKAEWPTFGVPGVTFRKIDYKPFDLSAVHIFKILGGQIHEIEALGFLAPYNVPTGWE
jgi:hypothetical protein